MTPSQLNTIQSVTSKIYRANQYLSGNDNLNGAINFYYSSLPTGKVMLTASNIECRDWFENSILVMVVIGKKGAIEIMHQEGVSI